MSSTPALRRYRWTILSAGVLAQGAFSAILLGLPAIAPAIQDRYDLLSAGAIVAPIAFAATVHHVSWRVAFVLAALSPLVGYALLSPLAERRP